MAQNQMIAQNSFNGFFINEADEFICFNNDTVWYRIKNNDAFGSFSIGKGSFEAVENKNYFKLSPNQIISHTSIIEKKARRDKELVITILDEDNTPFEFVQISISKILDESSSIICYSDEKGQLCLSKEQINLLNEGKVSIHVETLGFETEKIMELKPGYNYIIKSVIPNKYPFSIDDYKKIRIKGAGTNQIKIKIGNRLSSIFNKSNKNDSCSGFLLFMGE